MFIEILKIDLNNLKEDLKMKDNERIKKTEEIEMMNKFLTEFFKLFMLTLNTFDLEHEEETLILDLNQCFTDTLIYLDNGSVLNDILTFLINKKKFYKQYIQSINQDQGN